MAITNHERVGKAMDLLRAGLGPFVQREVKAAVDRRKLDAHRLREYMDSPTLADKKSMVEWDVAALLKLMWENWNEAFRDTLGPAERSLVGELRGHRNRWAHQESFNSDDAYRALDSAARLLTSVSAPESVELEQIKMKLLRVRFDEQSRGERRRRSGTTIDSPTATSLKPWREVVTPHRDVASGKYQQAEFAADLWQVHVGEGTDEYRDPVEFFRRTYLTESLKGLLVGAIRRLSGEGGDPVVQLQTNFGGGKTHSMLALYHLCSGTPSNALNGLEPVLEAAAKKQSPTARRVVLVGNKISPGNPSTKPDGTVVRTLWGELAWQLGGPEAFARIAGDDEKATNPGDTLRELFNDYGPCLILIDEWVAYARQLHDQSDLPAGSFETQFSFAQALTESAKLAGNCLLVISLPASDTSGSPHTQADDVEVGGQRGREALDRLRNVVGRIDSSWRPATAEEGFEIVRRRLFEPFTEPEQFKDRDVVADGFSDLYRTQQQEFPPECRESDYNKRIKVAYPIHPEVFDRLYTDWSTLVKFQRTRGVLRLMAAVIHSLWESGDRNPLILPANIAIDDPRIQFELTRYLSDNWPPVIEKDVDGPNSLPLQIDNEVPNLGKYAACRRVARTIYLGSAPTAGAAQRGIEDRRVKLGCVLPGESPSVFGDALRRLASAATYLYQDGQRYWYSTQPTVTKLAEDRADELKRDPDQVAQALDLRLREDLKVRGDFQRIHALPQSGRDVPDDLDARLVVLGIDQHYGKEKDSPAELAATAILESRGNTPRLYRNTLVFLAPDRTRSHDLDEALRTALAWDSILDDRDQLDLSPHQVKQAEVQRDTASGAVAARLPETYQWLLVPEQTKSEATIDWKAIRLSGKDNLAVRVSKRLKSDELMVSRLGGVVLRFGIDDVPLWRGNHVEIRQLVEDFARYLYLQRLTGPQVLVDAVLDGLRLLTWQKDSFAFADNYDPDTERYAGLRGGGTNVLSSLDQDSSALLVKPDIAVSQLARESVDEVEVSDTPDPGNGEGGDPLEPGITHPGGPADPGAAIQPTRFYGSVALDPDRAGRDASRIAEEVIVHLSGLVGAEVSVNLEIKARVPAGTPDHVVRTVTENARTLKFDSQGFEED